MGVPTLALLTDTGVEQAFSSLPEADLTRGATRELLLDLPAAGAYELTAGEWTNLTTTAAAVLLDRLTGTRYQPGTTVRFTAARGGEISGRFALLFGQRALGTAADAAALSFTLAPNPAHGVVRVHGAAATSATLLDATGRTVRTWTLTPGSGADLSLTGLAPGVYSVRVGAVARRLVIE